MRSPADVLWPRSSPQTCLRVLFPLALLMFAALTPAHAIFEGEDRSDADSQSVPAVGEWTPGSACSGNGCMGGCRAEVYYCLNLVKMV